MSALLGLGGYARAGKDTFVDGLVGWQRTYMSEPLERSLVALNPVVDWQANEGKIGPTVQVVRFAELRRKYGYDQAKENPEFRRLLIAMGTEVGRNQFGTDFWVNLVEKKIHHWLGFDKNVAVTGIRFENELATVRAFNGYAVWINRPGVGPVANHVSEIGLGPTDFDFVVENDGTVEDLHVKAQEFVKEFLSVGDEDLQPKMIEVRHTLTGGEG